MNPEDVLKKRILRKQSFEDSKLLEAVRSITSIRTKELTDASTLLAKTTQASAELLAKTTEQSAAQLSRSSQITVRWMKWLTVIGIGVGLIQIAIAVIAVYISLRLK